MYTPTYYFVMRKRTNKKRSLQLKNRTKSSTKILYSVANECAWITILSFDFIFSEAIIWCVVLNVVLSHLETSSKTYENIHEIFVILILEVLIKLVNNTDNIRENVCSLIACVALYKQNIISKISRFSHFTKTFFSTTIPSVHR